MNSRSGSKSCLSRFNEHGDTSVIATSGLIESSANPFTGGDVHDPDNWSYLGDH